MLYLLIPISVFDTEEKSLEGLELAQKAVEIASDKQATNVVLLDTREVCSFADYFVICSGESSRQVKTIYEEIEHVMKADGILPHHREGNLDSGWLLIDFGDVVIHIFSSEERDFYNLDALWSRAVPILRLQ